MTRVVSRLVRGLAAAIVLVLVLAVAAAFWAHRTLRASLPALDGEIVGEGLGLPVDLLRDSNGVVTVRGRSRRDVAWGLGFAHAQDRFFQMDMARRRAAGELAELLGPAALDADRGARVHRMRARAERMLASAPLDDRALFEAYTAGVNAGLAALRSRPFEYWLLRTEPAPWRPEDSALVTTSMFFQLQDSTGRTDSRQGLMTDLLPAPLVDFLTPRGTEWDAPLVGPAFAPAPIVDASVVNLREQGAVPKAAGAMKPSPGATWALADLFSPPDAGGDLTVGSNNWAVAGTHTADGRALVADDMHLGLGVPNVWYRASLEWSDTSGDVPNHQVTGATLPGLPSVVVGSNTLVAWGFTNTTGDWSDLVLIEPHPEAPETRYRTPDGYAAFERHVERIAVRGGAPVEIEVRETRWGPLVDTDHQGRPRALAWVAHRAEGNNTGFTKIETARNLEEAFAVAQRAGIPAQNLVAGDYTGRIAWTVAGRIPRRVGFDGRTPRSWADRGVGWEGWIAPAAYPRVVSPDSGRLWTANNRLVDGAWLRLLGDGGYDVGARGAQIRDGLLAIDKATTNDMLRIQLDDRALFLERWRRLAFETLDDPALAGIEVHGEARELLDRSWTGRASVDSVAYRLVRAFRLRVAERAFLPLVAPCREVDPTFPIVPRAVEGALWQLVTERPPHLLGPDYADWAALLRSAWEDVVAELTANGRRLADRTWGEWNTARIQHPLSRFVPSLARWLDMPGDPLPGDTAMPRVQGPAFGASQRMAVSPGNERAGYFQMPAGQSGHPLSPFYRSLHRAWVDGQPTPFLPGQVEHRLRLMPAGPR